MTAQVNMQKLVAGLKAKRRNRGLRETAHEIGGVSASTLSRIERGELPDLDTFVRICRWLGLSADELLDTKYQKDGDPRPTPEIIEAHLRADRTLNEETAAALAQLIRAAYEVVSQRQ